MMFKNLSAEALGISGHQWERIELALSYGFRGMELNLDELSERLDVGGLEFAQRLIVSAKIRLGGACLPVDLEADNEAYDQQVTRLRTLAEPLSKLGCDRLMVRLAPGSETMPYHENFERHRQRIAELAALLGEQNIKLGIAYQGAAALREGKQFEFIHDFDALVTFVNTIGASNVGLVVDLFEIVRSGKSVEDLRSLPIEQIVAVRVSDGSADVQPQEWTEKARLLPGETGVINASTVLTMLAEGGYDGPVTPVAHPARFTKMTRDAIVRLTGDSLDSVWSAAGLTPSGRLTATTVES
jgi:sugar phosphate isomerase/epimerase